MTVTIDGGSNLKSFLNQLKKQGARADVGFFPEAKYIDGTQVAKVAIYQEFGTETKDKKKLIPARPFLLPTFNENKGKWKKILANEIKKQQIYIDVKKALNVVGFVAKKDVQEKIDWWAREGHPRNAESTQKKKGFDSPLIQDGHMRESVNYKVSTK